MKRILALVAFVIAAANATAQAPAPPIERSDCSYFTMEPHPVAFDVFAIFFDFDSAAISAASSRILDNVAEVYGRRPHCAIRIWAHADRSGAAAYNQRLAARRARSIAAYLRSRGIRMPMRFEIHGESRPLVETQDGVRERQNRRAEILIEPRVNRRAGSRGDPLV
jgi:outer membrane protein OmpA-like peptidoglycan-associated protein